MKKQRIKKIEILIPPLYILEPRIKPKAKRILKDLFKKRK